jgi:hypothetical protein
MALKPDWRVGFSTGLKYWLFFMISLFLLRYDWLFCILIGLVAAVTTSVISAWWNAKEDEDAPAKSPEQVKMEETASAPPPKKVHFQRYGFLGKKRPTRGFQKFGWLFRRR